MTTLGILIAIALLLLVAYRIAFEPWMARWGATEIEATRTFPGDELWPNPTRVETRALTIGAPVSRVWAWLNQIGQDRGGFYSYSVLENLFGAHIRNADRILPNVPPLQAGARLWYTPREAFGGTGYSEIVRVDPARMIVLVGHSGKNPAPNGTWSFFLEPIGQAETRLVTRGLGGNSRQPVLQRLFERFIMAPTHFVMERRMLLGVKERAEGQRTSSAQDLVEVTPWLVAIALTVAGAIGAMLAVEPGWWLAVFAAGASGLLVLPLLRPPAVLSIAWVLLGAAAAVVAL
ncbi:MAG TPA: hypothetical protein VGB13_00340 [Candidatus Krumholzibacteria bacterium]|jgi:hypothetical protein